MNKYVIVTVLFFLYLTFMDGRSLMSRHSRKQEIQKLEQEYLTYKNEIADKREQISLLKNDTIFLEKFARERYYLKKEDEDVFVLK